MTGSMKPDQVIRSDAPQDVARSDGWDTNGDAADQAERLSMIMEAEAVHSAKNGGGGEGSNDMPYPLEDIEDVLAMEDAQDGSDDPMHAGGLTPARWVTAEEAAMHVVDGAETSAWLDSESDPERADPYRDQFDGPPGALTPEDETLMGVDPYDD